MIVIAGDSCRTIVQTKLSGLHGAQRIVWIRNHWAEMRQELGAQTDSEFNPPACIPAIVGIIEDK